MNNRMAERNLTLGSLFDGSGTAPLAASLCGIEPIWASEIEPYPIAVTKARFPKMKHLGSILEMDGHEIPPVDIICGGSPCQDLSVAGLQKGIIEGERSNLFFEMIRIIKEMRSATYGKYPRFVIWENVPGAFSSNKGGDFLEVLRQYAKIADPDVYVPEPPRNGDRLAWKYAGSIVGDGWSLAWRTVDAQYWGVPQRRRRIYLVLDLGSERAGEILFEREGMSGDTAKSGEARQGITPYAEGSAGRGCVYCLQGNGIDRADTAGCNGRGWREGGSYTLNTIDRPAVVYPEKARSLCARYDSSPCVDRGQETVVYRQTGFADYDEGCGTLRASGGDLGGGTENLIVCDARGNGDGRTAPTLTGDHQNRVTDYTAIVTGRAKDE